MKENASYLHQPSFKTVFGFQLNAYSKVLSLLLVEKDPSLNKSNSISKENGFKAS
jgi:hypothetical protein